LDNKEVETTILQTAGDAAKIRLTPDRTEISADGQDLSFITIDLTDAKGRLQPNAANRLHFKIEGPGTIAGVGNADMQDTDSYFGNSRKAWKGKALVVIRSTQKAGDIKITVSSEGLPETSVAIKSKK
jgi:beta-galactosidase